ncbi:phosphatidylinositol-3-phosphatase SAC1 isoform X3 [Curcuma longa]|uniref:phosphatidylinositol-3-phosphatase SAC1 isoform X3 n=1 Tax=Curcuma longa TaxID=136217 RepID=UPI003D9E169E
MAKRPPTPPLPVTSPPPGDQDLDPDSCSLEKFRLYETRARFYLIGSDRDKRFFRVLKIDRCEPSELNISEDPVVYSPQEVKSLLQRISEGNRATGGLSFFGKVYGIAGCIKFLESYYLILVTRRRQIGSICGHAIYCIDESQMISVPHSSIQSDAAHSKTELRYKKLLSSVDLTKDFFYSYTYPLMQCLQKNALEINTEKMPYENMFVWNAYLTQAIRSRCNNTRWTIALIHGHFKQIKLSIFGREFSVILISRRSRHFAGTRGKMSSVVQMRGSIPLFWSQEASRFSPKPDIVLQRYDPTYESTKLHFEDLAKRYGNPIIVLNLIKTFEKRPREMMLRREFANAVGYLNQILPEEGQLKFIHWDFHKFAKSKSANVLAVLGAVASEALDLTGFYYSGKPIIARKKSAQISRTSIGRDASIGDLRASSGDLARITSNLEALNITVFPDREKKLNQKLQILGGPRFQSGVLRTNCIDCLDRTNVAQYAYGLAALGRQLQALGLSDVPKIDADSSIAAALMDMYQSMGDALAQQYGGSAAHNTVFPERQGKWNATTQSREFLKSIRRYYSNAYTDGEKQDAINLFLGYFQPKDGKPALWELETDYYLHVAGIGDEVVPDSDRSLPFDTTHLSGVQSTLVPIPAYQRDFLRIKLASFDKLMEQTCSSLMNVRLYKESDVKANAIAGSSGMAPDAAEIQLKSPNWLFGHRKYEENIPATKVTDNEMENGKPEDDFCAAGYDSLNWLSHIDDVCEEDIFKKYHAVTSVDEDDNWYGGNLIYDQDENSEAYKHYAMLCQGAVMDPFEHDPEKEKHYAEALSLSFDSMNDTEIEVEMLAHLNEYAQIGADLGIVSSFKGLAEDPSQLTRWIIGEEKIEGWKK